MKLVYKLPLSAALTGVALTGLSLAQDWYVSGQAQWQQQSRSENGGAFTQDFISGNGGTTMPNGTPYPAGTSLGWNTEYNSGYGVAVELGRALPTGLPFNRRLPRGFRGSLELAFEKASVDTHTDMSVGGSAVGAADAAALRGETTQSGTTVETLIRDGKGDIENLSAFANVYYDLPLNSRIKPYIGGGIGVTRSNVTYKPSGTEIVENNDTSFAYQAKLGATYQISPRMELFGEYTYRNSAETEIDLDLLPAKLEIENERHLVGLGFRYRFGR